LISEAVIQSWGRCLRRQRQVNERVEFEPVSPSRAHHALQCNRELVEAWDWEVQPLRQVLRSTTCASVLTDASGVVIAAMPSSRAHERLMRIAHRLAVNLSADAVGTTAPCVVAKSGQALTVLGGDIFLTA
jgi:transcriptional regulator of acetoin/glycerol metabolism